MIQEQIQRLRESVTTCYNTVLSKNGVIPEEVGDFTVRNLPEAIESIPTSTSVLTDLEVTANGVYLPDVYSADGFSKVTANFDTSSLQKVKVASFKPTNDCIDENGYWAAELVDTSACTNMNQLFGNITNLKTIDVSDWDTSNVTVMVMLFYYCSSLEIIDLSKWDISKVTTMMRMFEGCSNLKEIRLDYWESLSVQDIQYMFSGCSSLQSLDVNHLNINGVTSLNQVFDGCKSLKALNLNNWDVSNVTSMGSAFKGCESLQSLTINNWNTHKCSSLYWMFMNCKSLTELDLSSWDTSNVTSMQQMFSGCNNLNKLDISNWEAGNVTACIYMFDGCSALETLVGGKTIETVGNNISCLKGLKVGLDLRLGHTQLDRASLRALINGLADVTDLPEDSRPTLALGTTLKAKLKEDEDIVIATDKGWTIA